MSESIPVVIGIDGGSTKTAVRIKAAYGSWSVLTVYRGAGTNLHAYRHPMEARTLGHRHLDKAIAQALAQAESEGHGAKETYKIVAAVIGTAGLDSHSDHETCTSIFRCCEGLSHLKDAAILITSDGTIIAACSSALIRLCLIADTESTCCLVRTDRNHREEVYINGLDLQLTDKGSAAWIGQRACQEAAKELMCHGRQYDLGLSKEICAALDIDIKEPESWRRIEQAHMTLDKGSLAALAESVVAPLLEGHRPNRGTAWRLFDAAVDDLCDIAATALWRLEVPSLYRNPSASNKEMHEDALRCSDNLTFLLVGGMWANDFVFESFRRRMRAGSFGNQGISFPTATFIRQVDPTIGAIAMARALLK